MVDSITSAKKVSTLTNYQIDASISKNEKCTLEVNGVFKGGGRMFGPRPRNYGFKLNKNLNHFVLRHLEAFQFAHFDNPN